MVCLQCHCGRVVNFLVIGKRALLVDGTLLRILPIVQLVHVARKHLAPPLRLDEVDWRFASTRRHKAGENERTKSQKQRMDRANALLGQSKDQSASRIKKGRVKSRTVNDTTRIRIAVSGVVNGALAEFECLLFSENKQRILDDNEASNSTRK